MANVLQEIGYALHTENLGRKDEALDAAYVEIERLVNALKAVVAAKMPGESRRIAHEALHVHVSAPQENAT